MRSHEHRTLGDAATSGALVNVGGDDGLERFDLTYGDVVALSGDFFPAAGPEPGSGGRETLFDLAALPGEAGTLVGTRDELVCALKVATVDEAVPDPRFAPGGRFEAVRFSPGADRSELERRVRDRYLALAAGNDDHFVAPGRSTVATASGAPSALGAYHRLHQIALEEARRLGRRGGDLTQAMAREAAAQHYLTDACAAGHLRTPVADIRRYWRDRYPAFWEQLRRKVAADTTAALRELSGLLRLVPRRTLHERTRSEIALRTSRYPELSLGDLVARAFHDWDNDHGLLLDGGSMVFGDGHVEEGETTALALAGIHAGNDDIEVAYARGASGSLRSGEPLYQSVREATGTTDDRFLAETRVPRLDAGNPEQNWWAPDIESLWESPMVGSAGPTVGEALTAMLDPDGQFIRQVDSLGQGLSGDHGVFAVPLLGRWLAAKCCHAFHHGFVEPLAADPKGAVLALVPSAAVTEAACAA